MPASEKATAPELEAEIDLGVIVRLYAAPGTVDEAWLKAVDRGLGAPRPPETATREFLLEATGSEGATLTVKAPQGPQRTLDFGQAWTKGKSEERRVGKECRSRWSPYH